MDGQRFDALTKAFARAPRRDLLKALAGIAVGSIVGVRGELGATAKDKPLCGPGDHNKRCGECGNCERQPDGDVVCVPLGFHCFDASTSDDNCPTCDPKTFKCRPGKKCGPCEECVMTRLQDPGESCAYSPQGRKGQCDPERNPCDPATGKCRCHKDLIFCDGQCVDSKTDRANCKRCGNKCGRCQNCKDGACVGCDDSCERCDEALGHCVSTCPGRCESCIDGRCRTDKAKCVACVPFGGGGVGAVAAVRAAPADVPECGPCEDCDLDQGCKPKACGACQECDQATGACVPKQCAPCEACQGGECVAVDCGDPCLECVDNACVPKACGDCEECVDGDCQAVDCGDPCLECRNNACAPIECPPGKHCSDGDCVCDLASCDTSKGQTPDPESCECICTNGEPACVIVLSGVRFSDCCPTTWVCSGGQCVCPEGQYPCGALPLPEEEQIPLGRSSQCASPEACCLAQDWPPIICSSPENGVRCCDARIHSGCTAEGLCQEICPGQIPCELLGLGEGCCIAAI
jgi:hypothetical protein